ncbi:hypothetical protein NC652_022218 [Populus alba x Populus x berolinensis]|uniref:Uncharacterized protein n=1 Tax=Populus alba x Populus x berolinensis TaxID=444605 RepID=A0AAD6QFE1_9ROSI|nr:hypothetical protein NC652_022218 [Populus alba x Populus x berolinensis]KAJ6989348.1 hypothetical protein NC653_022049 [Populus alba x Populus x berolinensis]
MLSLSWKVGFETSPFDQEEKKGQLVKQALSGKERAQVGCKGSLSSFPPLGMVW